MKNRRNLQFRNVIAEKTQDRHSNPRSITASLEIQEQGEWKKKNKAGQPILLSGSS